MNQEETKMNPKTRSLLIGIFMLIMAAAYFYFVWKTKTYPGFFTIGGGESFFGHAQLPIPGIVLLLISFLFFRNAGK